MTEAEGQELAAGFHRGEEVVFAEVYKLYSRAMFATAMSILNNRELAADAVQHAFTRAWQGAESFDPSREIKAWLYAITRRSAVDVYRRERKSLQSLTLDGDLYFGRAIAVEGPSLEAAWEAWRVREALDELSPDERQVLELAHFHGYSQSAIAEHLGVALGTVKSRTWRAHRKLTLLLRDVRDPAPAEDSALSKSA
ncbi:sigma-70 family RNA polymerase sigma factor [Kribbella sp. NBC_01505]|uniref:RNA polymerase sigma factor n=1 Tax=Kribbella sp. NBC_01505 TaxID=2903580 RepID=UPI00386642FC